MTPIETGRMRGHVVHFYFYLHSSRVQIQTMLNYFLLTATRSRNMYIEAFYPVSLRVK